MKKRWLTAAAVFLLAALLVPAAAFAGGQKESAAAKAGAKKVRIAYIMDAPDEWNQAGARAAEAKAKELGIELIVMNSNNDVKTQIDLVQSCISQKLTGYIILPIDNASLAPILRKSIEAGVQPISYFAFDKEFGFGEELMVYDFDQEDYGYQSALHIGAAVGGKGEVAVIGGNPGAKNTNQRLDGFKRGIAEKYPGLTLVKDVACSWDRSKAMAAAEDILTAHPNLVGIYAMDDGMAVGVVQAIEAAGKKGQVKVAAGNASKIGLEMLKNDSIIVSVECSPSKNAVLAVQALADLAAGKKVERYLLVKGDGITKEKAATYTPEF